MSKQGDSDPDRRLAAVNETGEASPLGVMQVDIRDSVVREHRLDCRSGITAIAHGRVGHSAGIVVGANRYETSSHVVRHHSWVEAGLGCPFAHKYGARCPVRRTGRLML